MCASKKPEGRSLVLQCALATAMNINTNWCLPPPCFKISLAVKRPRLSSNKEGNRPWVAEWHSHVPQYLCSNNTLPKRMGMLQQSGLQGMKGSVTSQVFWVFLSAQLAGLSALDNRAWPHFPPGLTKKLQTCTCCCFHCFRMRFYQCVSGSAMLSFLCIFLNCELKELSSAWVSAHQNWGRLLCTPEPAFHFLLFFRACPNSRLSDTISGPASLSLQAWRMFFHATSFTQASSIFYLLVIFVEMSENSRREKRCIWGVLALN